MPKETAQLRHCSLEGTIDNGSKKNEHGYVSIKLYLQRQAAGQIRPSGGSSWTSEENLGPVVSDLEAQRRGDEGPLGGEEGPEPPKEEPRDVRWTTETGEREGERKNPRPGKPREEGGVSAKGRCVRSTWWDPAGEAEK